MYLNNRSSDAKVYRWWCNICDRQSYNFFLKESDAIQDANRHKEYTHRWQNAKMWSVGINQMPKLKVGPYRIICGACKSIANEKLYDNPDKADEDGTLHHWASHHKTPEVVITIVSAYECEDKENLDRIIANASVESYKERRKQLTN